MDTEQMLSCLAILRAFATADHVGIEVLINDAPESSYADLLAFTIMVVEHHTRAPAITYIDAMANQLVAMHVEEVARSN